MIVNETLPDTPYLSLNGLTLQECIEELQMVEVYWKNRGYDVIRLRLDAGYNNVSVDLIGSREENAQEKIERLKKEEKKKSVAERKLEKARQLLRDAGEL